MRYRTKTYFDDATFNKDSDDMVKRGWKIHTFCLAEASACSVVLWEEDYSNHTAETALLRMSDDAEGVGDGG